MRIRRGTASVDVRKDGSVVLTPKAGKSVGGTGQQAPHGTKTALTPGAVVALNAALGDHFTLTPAQACQINATGMVQGQEVFIEILTSGTSSFVVALGTGFVTTGTLATGTVTAKRFMLHFLCNGTSLVELNRTAAM